MVRIGVLTSSRADFGVYLPLLRAFKLDSGINFEIIAFGTHLSNLHGRTIDEIEQSGFEVKYGIPTILAYDTEEAIATSAALTSLKFASFWASHKNDFDIVLCLGDRYEMFSAVIAGVPFGIKYAHFYGGDYSKGAIDNVYRDSLTHASLLHFTSNQRCADRVHKMISENYSVDVIGILSLDELDKLELLSIADFKNKWKIDLSIPTILSTFHPETISADKNHDHIEVVKGVLSELQKEYQIVITMPNADTQSILYRSVFKELKNKYNHRIYLIENFGIPSYFSCMKLADLMIGNTSSGISEAASFDKYFINIGSRQTGREISPNVFSVPFHIEQILKKIQEVIKLGAYQGKNIYKQDGAVDLIISKLKSFKN